VVFSSPTFLFWFLPLALVLYYAVVRGPRSLGQAVLAVLSYAFYGWANPPFMALMLLSTGIDYFCGRAIASAAPAARRRRVAVTISIVSNLGILGFFKYFNFGVESYNGLVEALGFAELAWRDVLRVTLPLGISFYTFQSMSYTIDVYRGHTRPAQSPLEFVCYVSLFSQLVAGPIIRFTQVADQLRSRTHTLEKFARGLAMLALGLGKKVLLANPCGQMADLCFDAASVSTLDAWIGAIAYAFQIYFDFSGYSDMAIGIGLLFGFVFPKNFDSPYRSASLGEFWRRWHISLSTWLRDYLYVPLGGNRKGGLRTYLNLGVVMVLGGLWHGAAATFLVWGGLHGVGLALERALGRRPLYAALPRVVRMALTFLLVLLAWVVFRASDLGAAGRYLGHMFGLREAGPEAALLSGVLFQPYYLATLLVAGAVVWIGPTAWDWTRRLSAPRAALALLLGALASAALFTQAYNPFIYFIF
jgi:alginate O-acetyltransferase complex protein AlgI